MVVLSVLSGEARSLLPDVEWAAETEELSAIDDDTADEDTVDENVLDEAVVDEAVVDEDLESLADGFNLHTTESLNGNREISLAPRTGIACFSRRIFGNTR